MKLRKDNADRKERAGIALEQAKYHEQMQEAADEPSASQSAVEARTADLRRLQEEGEGMQAAWDDDCAEARRAAAQLEYLLKWAYRAGTRRSATWLRREETIVWTAGIGWTDSR